MREMYAGSYMRKWHLASVKLSDKKLKSQLCKRYKQANILAHCVYQGTKTDAATLKLHQTVNKLITHYKNGVNEL